jgi:hypothetical protein
LFIHYPLQIVTILAATISIWILCGVIGIYLLFPDFHKVSDVLKKVAVGTAFIILGPIALFGAFIIRREAVAMIEKDIAAKIHEL